MKNYHTHTFRCNHAEGDVADYARVAVERGLTVLGISDHTSLPDDRWLDMRMASSTLPLYVQAIEEARREYTDLIILKGMECEWAPEYHNYFAEELLDRHDFDYLILGCHFFPYQGRFLSSHAAIDDPAHLAAYTDYLVRSMQSGLFEFVAHPDLFGLTYLTWDENTIAASKDILSAAQELQIPLEINGYGLAARRVATPQGLRIAYPWRPFWELAGDYRISVVVNSDAHHPDHVDQGIKAGLAMAAELGLNIADLAHLADGVA